ncbi:MAG: FeoA family protein [Synechococcales bacterium]|nr:FeoA family protein [Synechococcales bacterium]
MTMTAFSVQGTSLKLMRSGERGVITQIQPLQDATARKLKSMGFLRGQTICLEQRFPRFIVRVGAQRHALSESLLQAIYVRIVPN